MPRKRKTTATKNRRRIRRQRPTARNQKRQIASTQNQIVAIKQHLNLTKERMRWFCGFDSVSVTSYPLIIPLTSGPKNLSPANMNTVIPTPVPWNATMTPTPQNLGTLRSKVVVNKQYVDLRISTGNEQSVISFTAFIVQLQPKVAQQTYQETSQMSSLTRDADYCCPTDSLGNDSGYGAYINNQRYKIIKRLEFETLGGASGGAAGSTGNVGRGTRTGIMHRAQAKINYGSTIFKSSGNNSTTQTLTYSEINPEQKRFILLFSDNALLDLEFPTVTLSSLITGYAAE